MTTSYERLLDKVRGRAQRLLAASATVLLMSVALAVPAWAVVQPGNNITVFHEIDMVAASGYDVGDPLTIEVKRNGVVIGQTSGPAVSGPEGVGLEVNHEAAGVDDGSCWSGVTPDILPGDEIVVTSSEGEDSTTVLNVSILDGPFEATADDSAGLQAGDIVLEGVAEDENGNQLPLAELTQEMRDRSVDDFRASPNTLEYVGDTTEWRAIYRAPYNVDRDRGGLTQAEQKQAILNPSIGHELAWESPDLTVAMVSEGPSPGGPGPGCTAPREANAVTNSDDEAVNIDSGDLVLSGTAIEGTTAVSGTLSSNNGGSVSFNGTASLSNNATVQKTWTATIPRADLDTLSDGTLTTTTGYTVEGGSEPIGGKEQTILKDTVAPKDATATPRAGAYNTAQAVTLNAEDGSTIRYRVDGNDPTNTSPVFGSQIQVSNSQTIKARVFDHAGNRSEVASFEYTIDRSAPSLNASLASGSYNQARKVILRSNKPGAQIFYTTNNNAPNDSNTLYNGPITVNKSMTLKAIAIDQAGNRSETVTQKYVIRRASHVALNMATKNLKLGQTRVIAGKVLPAHKGKAVKVTIKRGGKQVLSRNLKLKAASNYKLAYKPKSVGRYSVNVRFAGDTDHKPSSATKSFRVVKR